MKSFWPTFNLVTDFCSNFTFVSLNLKLTTRIFPAEYKNFLKSQNKNNFCYLLFWRICCFDTNSRLSLSLVFPFKESEKNGMKTFYKKFLFSLEAQMPQSEFCCNHFLALELSIKHFSVLFVRLKSWLSCASTQTQRTNNTWIPNTILLSFSVHRSITNWWLDGISCWLQLT